MVYRTKYHVSKAGYAIQVPHVGDAAQTSHLLSGHIIESVTAGTHQPMNPHKQRLLAAEARAAVLPKDTKKQPKKRAPSKTMLKEKKAAQDPDSSRSAYSSAKNEISWTSYLIKFFLLVFSGLDDCNDSCKRKTLHI